MKEGIVSEIDTKIVELTEKLKKSTDYFENIAKTIEKLSNDKLTVQGECNFINGALQAYKNLSEEFKKVGYVADDKIEIVEVKEEKTDG
jgi:arabinogalactan endo-1,4-beta-galactosidase